MTAQTIVSGVALAVAAVFGSSVIVAFINRRQVSAAAKQLTSEAGLNDANAARIIAETATALLEPTTARLARAEERITELEKGAARFRRLARAHAAWDRQAVQKLRQVGIALPDPPPLDFVA